MKRFIFLLVWIGILSAPHSLPAFMPTDDQLRTTESTNFIYIYQSALEDQIPGLIGDCEDAYTLLTPIFQWRPRKKTIVLFSDGYDIHCLSAPNHDDLCR